MPLEDHHRSLQGLDRLVAREVSRRIAEHGVPRDQDEVLALAEAVHPVVSRYRHEYYLADVRNLGATFAEYGLEVAPARERSYPLRAVVEAVQRAAGFGRGSEKIGSSFVDEATAELLGESVAAHAFADDPGVQRQFVRRLSAALVRHARKAGRDGLVDSMERGHVRDAVTKRPFGGDVGYARVLTGRESCAFCAMLASRGPVYSKDTVLRTDVGRRYHDNCDCIAIPVVRGRPWPGKGEFKKLQRKWRAVTWENGHPAGDQWEKWREYVAAGGLNPANYSPLNQDPT